MKIERLSKGALCPGGPRPRGERDVDLGGACWPPRDGPWISGATTRWAVDLEEVKASLDEL